MKSHVHFDVKVKGKYNGLVCTDEELNSFEYKGEIVYKECNKEEYKLLKNAKIGDFLEDFSHPGIKFEIIANPIICSENSISFYVRGQK